MAAGFVDAHDQPGQESLTSGAQVEHAGLPLTVGLGGDPAVVEAPTLRLVTPERERPKHGAGLGIDHESMRLSGQHHVPAEQVT